MENFIFRVQTKYGIRDYDTLHDARENSKEGDKIQIMYPDGLTEISHRARKYATPAWALQKLCKTFDLFGEGAGLLYKLQK